MLGKKKKQKDNQQQDKDAKVEARLAALERKMEASAGQIKALEVQMKSVREDTDKLQHLLADNPDDRVRMLLNSISSKLQGDLSKTIDDAQALHEMTAKAKESLNELNGLKSSRHEKILSEEIQRAASDLRLLSSGNDLDTLVLIILNGFRGLGWCQIGVYPTDDTSAWSFRDGDPCVGHRELCLFLSKTRFAFMTTSEGREALCRTFDNLGMAAQLPTNRLGCCV